MRRLSLGAWLALMTAGLVLLALSILVPSWLTLLDRLASEGARSRVELAAIGAAEGVERFGEDSATAARILAGRPTLQRLVRDGDGGGLSGFLESFRSTADLDGCGVTRDGTLLGSAPVPFPLSAAGEEGGRRYDIAEDGTPEIFASEEIPGLAGARAVVYRRLDDRLVRSLSEQAGVSIRLITDDTGSPAPGEAYTARRSVGNGPGPRIQVEALLPEAEVAASLRPVERTFTFVTILAGAIAIASGAVAGRLLARPFRVLQAAAHRIGAGDLATQVPGTSGAEAGALSASMEGMRRRLRATTTALRRRESEAQALLSGIVEGVLAVDSERKIQYLNPQAEALLDAAAGQVAGRFCGDVLLPAPVGGERPCEGACPIVHARSRGGSRSVEHLQLRGGRRTVVITSSPPADGTQVLVLRDETEIEAARRQRDAVLANVSHELKTPLSAQLASIELLRDGIGSLPDGEIAALVASLERSTLRLTRLIDNLLESVRIETGRESRRRLPVELAAVAEEAAAMTRPLLDQRSQRLEIDLPAGLPPIEGDPGQLTQVFVNLLANAHKYAPDGTAIRIGAAAAAAEVEIWVEDSGPGVSPAASASIFDRFHRADQEGEGMGLGLWIVKSIVERHGGSVSVDPAPGGGARFTVTLPAGRSA
ncbi:MAG TPA: ATP-binding protein [Candidatus Saccharimonadales bacterium]|nr:ATP-binding protein [Candidatus Saccharimonadales bacterium]